MFDHISFLFSADSDWSYGFFSLVASALFFLGYWLLMRNEKRHQMVRFYLLSTLALSMLLPLVHIRVTSSAAVVEEASAQHNATDPEVIITWNGETVQPLQADRTEIATPTTPGKDGMEKMTLDSPKVNPLHTLVVLIYLAGAAVMLLLFVVRIGRLGLRLRRLDFTPQDGYRLALVEGDQPAFSFFKRVVIGKDHFSQSEIEQLTGHELVHVRQCHSLDVLFCEVLKVLCWFNPFVWLYARELKRVHEFQADELMMAADGAASYAELLYHQLSGHNYSPIGNNFDYRITQKRIKMMKTTKKRFGSLSLLVVLPVVALLLFANCRQQTGLDGTYYVSNMVLTHDDANNTEITCGKFCNLEDRTLRFHDNGTVDVRCKSDKSVNFHGTYTFDKQGLRIYGPDGQLWMDMDQTTDYCGSDSISITYSDSDPMRGLETMVRTLSINKRPTRKISGRGETTDPTGKRKVTNYKDRIDTIYPEITIVSKDYDYMVAHNWFFDNRMLRSSVADWITVSGVDTELEKGKSVQYFHSEWSYPEGTLAPDARINYDTLNGEDFGVNPKRDDYKFQLRVELKRK